MPKSKQEIEKERQEFIKQASDNLQTWTNIEALLFEAFHHLSQPTTLINAGIIFDTIKNVNQKRELTDAFAKFKLRSKKRENAAKAWAAIYKKLKSKAKYRNRLAHYQLEYIAFYKDKEWLLTPPGYSKLTLHERKDWEDKIVDRKQLKQIRKDFEEIRFLFFKFFAELDDVGLLFPR